MSDIIKSDNNLEMSYYSTVRDTIHSFDEIRLNAAAHGLTICSAFIIAAITAINLANTNIPCDIITLEALRWIKSTLGCMDGKCLHLPTGHVLAIAIYCILSKTAHQYSKKIEMFGYFIGQAVEISLILENTLLKDEKICLTKRFNKHPFAHDRGDELFLNALRLIRFTAWAGIAFSTLMIAYNFWTN